MGVQTIHSRYTRSLASTISDLRVKRRYYLLTKANPNLRAARILSVDSEIKKLTKEIETFIPKERRRTWK